MRNLTFGEATIILSIVFVTSAAVVLTSFVPALERLRATEDETRELLFELARKNGQYMVVAVPEQHADEPRVASSTDVTQRASTRSTTSSKQRAAPLVPRPARLANDELDDSKCSPKDPICGIRDL